MFAIRPTHTSDLPALYQICLVTGLHGKDATGLVDPEILGHYFLAPYFALDPTLCFTLTANGEPVGYIVGTDDTARFDQRCEVEWWPALRNRYKQPSIDDQTMTANMVRAIHERAPGDSLIDTYPAHLHINLLPSAQSQGQGKALILKFCETLIHRGVHGLHLGVSPRNQNAQHFYQRLGFEHIKPSSDEIVMAIHLDTTDLTRGLFST